MTEAVTAHEITIRRVFDAPLEAVWDAWTQPDQLAAWWGPPGWSTPLENVALELRPGGTMRVTSVSDEDGTEMTTTGILTEVSAYERLVFDERPEEAWHEGATSSVTFTDLGEGRTEMVMRSTINTTEELRAQAEAGVNGAFDRLAELLS
jgi:uncharacterized protein YndB with AHSA1/START domain